MARLAALILLALTLASPVGAQVIAPLAGEHADFTRVVLRLPRGADWRFTPEGRERVLTLSADGVEFDLRRIFDRIPRNRLAAVRAEGGRLTLSLACDCPVRAWEDRPGLLILDIADAPAPVAPPAPPLPRLRPAADPLTAARAAGASLARLLPRPEGESAPADPLPEDEARLRSLAGDLGRSVASAMTQGLLDPAVDSAALSADSGALGLLSDTPLPELPENMRVATVLSRRDPAAPPRADPPSHCAGADLLDRMMDNEITAFGLELGRLTRALYGEFDQPDPQARLDLIGLYLAAGFGAEARALIVNGQALIAGRDFALGMADVLEDRASNARMRLAMAIDCGGAAAVLATLAGADPAAIARQADRIALRFSTFPAPLRGQFGVALAGALADVGAIDAARIVADVLERSDWVSRPDLALVQARLDRARGLPDAAAARLAQEGGTASETVRARLDLALETRGQLDTGFLANAEALAATARDTGSGVEMMAAVIRLNARSGASPEAFAALDRLESWMPPTGENRRMLGTLRDEVWAALAATGSDFGLVEAVLARDDWQDPALADATRRALAQRLLELGLTTPVADLLDSLADSETHVLQARRALSDGDPVAALAGLDGLDDPAAREVRAEALARLGDHGAAAGEFARLGAAEAAARAAILAGDWRRVEALAAAQASPGAAMDLGPMLGRAPGHAEVARATAAEAGVAPLSAVAGSGTAPPPVAGQATESGPADRLATALPPRPTGAVDGASDGDALAAASPAPVPGVGQGEGQGGAQGPAGAARPETGLAAAAIPSTTPAPGAAPRTEGPDPGALFDRLGLVQRSSTLLTESERLRDALGPLLAPANAPTN